jgi:hypothetical protein
MPSEISENPGNWNALTKSNIHDLKRFHASKYFYAWNKKLE